MYLTQNTHHIHSFISIHRSPACYPGGLVFQQCRLPDHLNKPHDPFKTVDIREPQGLIQFEVNGLLLAFFNGNIRRVKVHAITVVKDRI